MLLHTALLHRIAHVGLIVQERASGNHLDGDLALVLSSVASACKRVSALVAAAPIAGNTGEAGSTNMTGEEQKKLDVLANEVFCECVASSGRTGVVVTEEEDVPVALEATSGNYVVTFGTHARTHARTHVPVPPCPPAASPLVRPSARPPALWAPTAGTLRLTLHILK